MASDDPRCGQNRLHVDTREPACMQVACKSGLLERAAAHRKLGPNVFVKVRLRLTS